MAVDTGAVRALTLTAIARGCLLSALAVLGVAAAACGGSSSKPATPTGAPAATVTATPPARPQAQVTVTGSTYRFSKKGYSVVVPQGWADNPDYVNDVSGGQFPTDVMFPVGASGDVATTIIIECLKPAADQQTTDAFRDGQVAFLQQIGTSVGAPRAVHMGDQPAYAIDYLQEIVRTAGNIVLEKTDVLAVVGGCRWLVTLSAPNGQRAGHSSEFEAMLGSMEFFTPE